eukprot:TRINITY_DN23960_c0_g1_i1.p1 TRINITY_DN23960_c0_g1~~TRINITY_DN23960_c0_g1_i1.p1  ORF type:complete len:230 (-),score=59.85 TRINITY_DN23960_c0_g1_i1:95-784(-)
MCIRDRLKAFKAEFEEKIKMKAHQIFEFPSFWTLPQERLVQKLPLSPDSKEFQDIRTKFLASVPGFKIVYIKRVQNLKTWQDYAYERNKMQEQSLSGAKIREECLFHGTSGVHPNVIYKNTDFAFDARLSRDGMWGRGIYFATTAKYSHAYSYASKKTVGKVERKMIFANVLLGDCKKLESDRSLTRPPMKPDGKLYDSVEGFTSNTVVFIVYNNQKAYPQYLIKYTET